MSEAEAVYAQGEWWRRTTGIPNQPPLPALVNADDLEAGRLLDAKGNVIKIVRFREKVPFGFSSSGS